jgi:hypothetical protein
MVDLEHRSQFKPVDSYLPCFLAVALLSPLRLSLQDTGRLMIIADGKICVKSAFLDSLSMRPLSPSLMALLSILMLPIYRLDG